ncbi:putative respiratory complex assembly protein Rmp1 [Aspergillus lucknowensis]|uniref:Mitochondrial inner-membrane-bound regulator-domain-containing protein n=1 Tax=Aspergillus lucknowensis TaxID=176173 RepID=A0ABR4M3F7_9EURO
MKSGRRKLYWICRRLIIDLNNIPLVSGTAYIKWRLPSSNSNEHHGATDKALIVDHRASWNYERTLQLRLTIDRDHTLHECEIQFDVIQEFSSGGHVEKNLLGRVKLNLSEYVDKSDDDEGIVRRYLMQDSKINSTLKVGVVVQQTEGDRNFTTPPLKSAMAFGGITGVVASEQAEADDMGQLPSINTQSREVADMQEMYRRTLAASWTSHSDDPPADKLIEELFCGSVGWADPRGSDSLTQAEGHPNERSPSCDPGTTEQTGSRRLLSPGFERRARSSSRHRNGNKARDFPPTIVPSGKSGGIERQLYDNIKGKNWRNRNTEQELSEFDVRDDLRSWEIIWVFPMLSLSFKHARGLFNSRLTSVCPINTVSSSFPPRRIHARYQSTAGSGDDSHGQVRDNLYSALKRRNRNKRGDKIRKVELEVPTLGTPAQVIVLHEAKRRPKSSTNLDQAKTDAGADENELPFILRHVDQDIGADRFMSTIEGLRLPYEPQSKLAASDWEVLRSRLRSSFSSLQLSEYISKHSETGHNTGWFSNPAVWRPGTSHMFEKDSVSTETVGSRVATSKNLRKKDRLAEQILRDCWKLEISNETGQLDVHIPNHTLSLLLASEHFSFEELASLHEAKIDVSHALGLVRVTGKRRPCESICEMIHDATNRIRQEETYLLSPSGPGPGTISRRILTVGFLSWVEETYKVSLERSPSQPPSRIYYLLENKLGAENARRALNLAINKARSPPVPFSTYMSASELFETHVVNVEDTAAWPDRAKPWFRWGTPPKQDMSTRHSELFFNKRQSALSDELFKLLRQPSCLNTWSGSVPEVQESVTAAVGKSLFLRKPSFEEGQVSASQLGNMSLPRTFINHVPRATQILRLLTPRVAAERTKSHRIRLVPSARFAENFPQLELEIASTADNTSGHGYECVLCSAKAVLEENSVDYLLPETTSDIRFTRKLTHELVVGSQKIRSLETVRINLRDCLNWGITNDSEVPLPAFASITLPAYLLRSPLGELDSNGCATAEYLYLPVNDVRGTQIHHSCEGGPFNPPTSDDLFLQLDLGTGNLADSSPSSSFHSFYNAACSLAFEIDLV